MTLEESTEQYKEYIDEHIRNVQAVWESMQPYLKDEYWLDDFTWHTISGMIKKHDKSKSGIMEFEGYRQWFYPTDTGIKNKERFAYAWNHHQKTNPHHWEYWLMWEKGETIALSIPFIFIFEMLCDWGAMSLHFNDLPSWFYHKNKSEMHKETQQAIELWLPILDKTVKKIIKERVK